LVFIDHGGFFMIEFRNVTFKYPDGTLALDDISLDIANGEKVAILGNNGSGKTTLALLIDGILRPSSGAIRINGCNPNIEAENKVLRRAVGMVFQNPDNQLVATTVEMEIAFSLENQMVPHPEIDDRVNETLNYFGLLAQRHRLTSELSGGEKQRLSVAAVMASRPKILILDEPGSYLDELGKKILNGAILKLKDFVHELTIIRITQYASMALDFDRVVLLKNGKIIFDGPPARLFAEADLCARTGIGVPIKYRIEKKIEQSGDKIIARDCRMGRVKSIVMDGLSFAYDKSESFALNIGHLNITDSKIYGMVGPSGSGKSTLIQIMAGLLKPVTGKVEYQGFEPKSGALAVSFQHPEKQFFLDTVDREIRFGAENLKLSSIDEITENSYRLIGLPKERFSNRDPFTLSGGEKRRLAFGAILSLLPSFVLFDEPTSGLDFEGIQLFKKMVRDLSGRGVGIILISHYGDIVFDLAEEVITLKKGQIESIFSRKDFFVTADYSQFLSIPEVIDYQMKKWGVIKYHSESELIQYA